MAKIIDGKKIAEEIKSELKREIMKLKKKNITPGLAVILVGDDPASAVYVRNKIRTCAEVGIYSKAHILPKKTSQKKIIKLIEKLNRDKKIHGILVQLPLPKNLDEQKITEAIDPQKDVDCFCPENIGKLFLGLPSFLPCTPSGVIEILKRSGVMIAGKNAVIVGRSNIVGKPLSIMLLQENATITVAHSKTKNLKEVAKKGDILISAVGGSGLIRRDMVKRGAVVIDVGITRIDGKLKGDVDFEEVKKVAKMITPVPGGVGPMTVMMLMRNTVKAAQFSIE